MDLRNQERKKDQEVRGGEGWLGGPETWRGTGGGIQAGQWGEELKSADIPLGWTFSRKTL